MAGKAGKNNKTIIGVACAVIALIVIVVLLLLFTKPGGIGLGGGLKDEYFVSDGSKLVVSLDKDDLSFDEEEFAPVKMHEVYYYSGEAITGMSYFYEYEDASAAEKAFDHVKTEGESQSKEIKLNGKYIEIVMNDEYFTDLTVESVKNNIEFMEMIKKMDYDDGMSDDVIEFSDDTGEEVVEDEVEEEEYE